MAKKNFTPPSWATDTIQSLADLVKDQAATLKAKFDLASLNIKTYVDALLLELGDTTSGNSGSNTIGHGSASVTADNVGDALEENRVETATKAPQATTFTKAELQSQADGLSGMDLVGMTPINGVMTTPQQSLEYLKTRVDATSPTTNIYTSLDNGLVGDGVTNDATALNALIALIGSKEATILFTALTTGQATYLIQTNVVFPENINVEFLNGATLKVDNTLSVTGTNTKLTAGLYQVFDLSLGGTIQGSFKVKEILTQWFGAKGDDATDSTSAFLNSALLAKSSNKKIYIPTGIYLVNQSVDITGVALEGDGRILTIIKTNSTSTAFINQGGVSPNREYLSLKGMKFENNGGTSDCIKFENSPRHNNFSDIFIQGYTDGAGIVIGDDTWITNMNEVFIANCKWGLRFDRTISIGSVGGNHVFVGGGLESCERAFEGKLKNLSFFGTTIEGNTGMVETFSDGNAVGGITKLGIGEGPIAMYDTWGEGNALPSVIVGVDATSEATATQAITIIGGRHDPESLLWIRGNVSNIKVDNINFGWATTNRMPIIWSDNRNARMEFTNNRYNPATQKMIDTFTYGFYPKIYFVYDGDRIYLQEDLTGKLPVTSVFKRSYYDLTTGGMLYEDFVEGGSVRTY